MEGRVHVMVATVAFGIGGLPYSYGLVHGLIPDCLSYVPRDRQTKCSVCPPYYTTEVD